MQMATKKQTEQYGNSSISMLKGEDRVRKRPAVIFGSDDLEGCKHAVFEILSNAIDEAREGHGDTIIVTRYEDLSVEVEDFGRGCPVDYNEKEKRYNWELVFCEMYAGGKYNNNSGDNYEFSLGLNGLGLCATQYASEYMTVDIIRDGFAYHLDFEKGENVDKSIVSFIENSLFTTLTNVNFDADLADQHKVMASPTLLLFKEGKKVGRKQGVLKKQELVEWVTA